MKLEDNILYLNNIRDKIDSSIRAHGRVDMIPTQFIADNLARACADGKKFIVNYVKVKPSDKTFVMCCYPDIKELNNVARPLVEQLNDGNLSQFLSKWNSITTWHIEIDKRLLTPGTPITVDNGSQFVAILCHELGHIMNVFPARLISNYKINKATESMLNKALSNALGRAILTLFLPMFVCVNGLRIIISSPGKDLNEMAADARVPNQYKPYLIDYTNNHILPNAETGSGIVVTNEEYNNEQNKGIQFSRSCIVLMKKRASVLKIHLATFGKLSPSPYLGELSGFMLNTIGGTGETENLIEAKKFEMDFNRSWETAVTEAAKMSAMCEAHNVTERDLLLLQVDIDGMETLDDKSYVLNTIFDYKESLTRNKAKTIKKIKDIEKISAATLTFDEKIKRLDEMQKQVMSKKISQYTNGNEFAVYVKYPKGYEG